MALEESALVFDNGSDTLKTGFSECNEPQLIIPSLIGRPRTKFLNKTSFNTNLEDTYVGSDAQTNRGILALNRPVENGVIRHWDDIEKLWQYCFDKLDARPEEQPILLADTPDNPKCNREKMAEVMFETFNATAFYVAIQGVLSLHAHGLVTGVALDCGADITQIVPIVDGYSIQHATSCIPLGGSDLTLHLLKLLAENGITFKAKHCVEDVRDVKEKFCYVAANFDKERQMTGKSSLIGTTYTLPDKHKITIGNEQFCCPEALFQPQMLGKNLNGIHEICIDSIVKSNQSEDITKNLYGNIVLSGGSTMFPGLPSRFFREINKLVPLHISPNLLVVESRQNNVWTGGSIIASLPAFQEMWLTKQVYEENGPSYIHKKCI